MRVLLVLGRRVGVVAENNLNTLRKLSENTLELGFLFSNVEWTMILFDQRQVDKLRAKYGFIVAGWKVIPNSSLNAGSRSKLDFIHPNKNKLSKRTFNHLCNILYRVESSNLVVAANESGKGRPEFALNAARSHFIPHLDLSSNETTEKLKLLEERIDKLANKDRGTLTSYIEQFKLKHNIEFKLSESINTMSRVEIETHIKKIKQLL